MTIKARHLRYRLFDRLRHGKKFILFLATEAARLAGAGSGRTVTFTNTSNIVNEGSHGYATGDGPFMFANSGGALPTGVVALTHYWVSVVGAATYKLHLTEADALAVANIIGITTDGTGTNTVLDSAVDKTVFNSLLAGNTAEDIRSFASADDL